MPTTVIRKLDCGCEILSDDTIYLCIRHEWEKINLLHPSKFPTLEEFKNKWINIKG